MACRYPLGCYRRHAGYKALYALGGDEIGRIRDGINR